MRQIRHSGVLDYRRHFTLLVVTGLALAIACPWRRSLGLVANFGLFGTLYAALTATTVKASVSWVRKTGFVALSGMMSMLIVVCGLNAARSLGAMPGGLGSRVVLGMASGAGALVHLLALRGFFAIRVTGFVVPSCILSPLAVVAAGIHLECEGLWLAVAWWTAFSASLFVTDIHSKEARS